jgi:hypothetical protein
VTTWAFTLRLNRTPSDAELDALYDAGLDDSAPEGNLLHVDREADDLLAAVWSASRDVSKVPGLTAIGLDRDDAVTLRDVALRMGRTYEAVRLLAEGARGPGSFPKPQLDTTAGRIWSWHEVSAWLATHYPDTTPDRPHNQRQYDTGDALLRLAAHLEGASDPELSRVRALIRQIL